MSESDCGRGEPDQHSDMARLRDRTDEIELIISGLTTFALFTLPSWLFERLAENYTHLSLGWVIGGTSGTALITGLCYGLGGCFLVHLLTRAYWVGLIGLRTVFPSGINWDRTPGVGPITRKRYLRILPDLEEAIARSDKVASSLFAVISLIALSVLWFGAILLVILTIAGVVGASFGMTNHAITIAFLAVVGGLFVGMPLLLWLLDAQLARRWTALERSSAYGVLVRGISAINGLLLPQRLILPVQLTLQSNTRPLVFVLMLFLGVAAIVFLGNLRLAGWTNFTLSSEFRYLDGDALRNGLRSTHYEDQRSPLDRVRPWPMIPTFRQHSGFVEVFLPYQPLRDNLILDQLCAEGSSADAGMQGAECLKLIWAVELNGRPVATDDFLPTERVDLGMLGLTGIVPLQNIAPGLQRLGIIWNPLGADGGPVDDRYEEASFDYTIPFLFSPDFEQGLDDITGLTP